MVTVERTAIMVQLGEQETRFPPPGLSPDQDQGEEFKEEEEEVVRV